MKAKWHNCSEYPKVGRDLLLEKGQEGFFAVYMYRHCKYHGRRCVVIRGNGIDVPFLPFEESEYEGCIDLEYFEKWIYVRDMIDYVISVEYDRCHPKSLFLI